MKHFKDFMKLYCGLFLFLYLGPLFVAGFAWYRPIEMSFQYDTCLLDYCLEDQVDQLGSTTTVWFHLLKLDKTLLIDSKQVYNHCSYYRQNNIQECCYLLYDIEALRSSNSTIDIDSFQLDCNNNLALSDASLFLIFFGIMMGALGLFLPFVVFLACYKLK